MKHKFILLILCAGLLCASCEDWLDATSTTEISGDKLFETEDGFKDALIGTYLSLGETQTYGKNLSFYFSDLLAYPYLPYGEFQYILQRAYTSLKVTPYIDNIWTYNYRTIANVNNLLKNLEEHKNVLHSLHYSLIKGELHGLRAFAHFDLLRMFGQGNWANDPTVGDKLTIPYVTVYSKDETEQLTHEKTFELLIDDLEEALLYLAEDPIRGIKDESYYTEVNRDGFYSDRNKRMNYYAVKALMSRTYMWRGTASDRTTAAKLAEEVISEAPYTWIKQENINGLDEDQQDLTFSTEQLFSLEVTGLGDVFNSYYSNTGKDSPSLKLESETVTQHIFNTRYYEYVYGRGWWYNDEDPTGGPDGDGWFYEDDTVIDKVLPGAADVRFARMMISAGGGDYYSPIKLRQVSGYYNIYRNRLPLIRISEMYYILSECYAAQGNTNKALEMLDIVRENRGIVQALDSDSDVEFELTKEYMREFICEGQFFYYLKRRGITDPLQGAVESYTIDLEDFLIPYPTSEVEVGNRVQE